MKRPGKGKSLEARVRPEFLGSRTYLIGMIRLHVYELLSRIIVFGFTCSTALGCPLDLLSFLGINLWRGHLELKWYVTSGVDPAKRCLFPPP